MKQLKKYLSAAAAGLLALTMMSSGVLADDSTPTPAPQPAAVDTVPITKTVVTQEKDKYVRPATGLRFRFAATGVGDDYDPTAEPGKEFAGPDGGLTITEATEDPAASQPGKIAYSGGSVHADASAFPGPGLYVYNLAEQPNPDGDAKYEGIKNDDSQYQIKVHVINDEGTQKVDSIIAANTTNLDAKVANLSFVNQYQPGCITVKKLLSGNQAVYTDVFPFTLDLQGAPGETYVVEQNGEDTTLTADDQGKATFNTTLGKDQSFTVCGLSETDTYKVTETDTKGYTSRQSVHYTQQDGLPMRRITVLNYKNGTVPTGIITNYGPYVVLVGLATVLAILLFKRSRRED